MRMYKEVGKRWASKIYSISVHSPEKWVFNSKSDSNANNTFGKRQNKKDKVRDKEKRHSCHFWLTPNLFLPLFHFDMGWIILDLCFPKASPFPNFYGLQHSSFSENGPISLVAKGKWNCTCTRFSHHQSIFGKVK